eukprot:1303669-Pleurochrysis_carterae.AAC.1
MLTWTSLVGTSIARGCMQCFVSDTCSNTPIVYLVFETLSWVLGCRCPVAFELQYLNFDTSDKTPDLDLNFKEPRTDTDRCGIWQQRVCDPRQRAKLSNALEGFSSSPVAVVACAGLEN